MPVATCLVEAVAGLMLDSEGSADRKNDSGDVHLADERAKTVKESLLRKGTLNLTGAARERRRRRKPRPSLSEK
jgi:hypothetical protein